MHVVIFNGSPRTRKNSNTDKIISSFIKGLERTNTTFELFSLSDKSEWGAAREAYLSNDRILIALPLFVECIPAMLLEFLETLPKERETHAQMSFILQGGFDEGAQMRCGEAFLNTLPKQLGCSFGGVLVKGGNFCIRILDEKNASKMLSPFETMGESFGRNGNFLTDEAKRFVGIERYPYLVRLIVRMVFKTSLKKRFDDAALKWGCTRPLDDRPYSE
ncbi:MAG: hypothetical protein ACI358_03830 [Candidatus Limimorpha sp.]